MDLQTKKLHFIEEILAIQNEEVIDKLELVLREERSLDPVLKDKLTSRALKAERDIAEGRTMTRDELEQKLNARLGL